MNPAPGGGTSNAQTLTVNNPVPTLSSISPTSTTAGGSSFTLTVNGTNFNASSTVDFNGVPLTIISVSSTTITVTVPASDITVGGSDLITVVNPAPGGGTTSAQTLTVKNPVPTTTSISPTPVTAGGNSFTLTVDGTNFNASSTVDFNGVGFATTYASSTQLTITVPATDIAVGGTDSITVVNPAPGGGTSNAQTLTVNNPVPTLSSISPTSTTAGGSSFTLTVNGTNFNASSTVDFNGVPLTIISVSSTTITVTVPASDITVGGSDLITVVNPAPGGGTSNAQTLTVNNPVPTLSSISPTSTTAGGSSFTLTVNGTNFNASSTVDFNGVPLTIISVSSTTITVTVPASDITVGGSDLITVVNPAPGGGTTSAQTLTVKNPVPTTTSISPTPVTAGGNSFTLTVDGTNFNASSTVDFNGVGFATTYASSTQLTITVPATDIAVGGTDSITVVNPAPGGGTSNAQTLTVNNPVPTLSSISPTSTTAGGSSFTLTVNGTNFNASSTVDFNGVPLTIISVSSTTITVTVPASDITVGGSDLITVVNPAPGGGTTSAQTLTVKNPVPTTTSISPTPVTAGGNSFTLTVDGTNFNASSTVDFNGVGFATTYASSTQLTITVPATDIAVGGTDSITVVNPAPGGGTSNAQTLTVNNPVPTLSSISPTSTTAGGSSFTLTVNGTNFNASSTVDFNGVPLTIISVSSTTITVTVPASDITVGGSDLITVVNPAPGGGTSNAQTLTVNNPVPTLSSISPTSTTAGGSSFTLTVNGTNFNASSTVDFNGVPLTIISVSSTTITVTVPASDITVGGSDLITVVNPAPGGGTTSAQTLTVKNPVPTTTSISPTPVTAGGNSFTLTVDGTNFNASSTVDFNGVGFATTYASSTQLTITVPATDIAVGGSDLITVVNPAPGGGTTSAQTLTVNLANQAALIITNLPASATYGQAGINASTTGGSGTGAITFSADGSSACSVATSTGVVSITSGTGTCSITATKAADTEYNATTSVAVSITIGLANQATLVASSTPSTLSYGATSTLSSSGGSGTGAVSFSVGASTGCSISNGTTLTNILASGTCSVTATKAADNDYNATTSAPITITLTQATSSVTVTCPATPQPYTGSAQTPCTASYTTSDGLSGSLTPTYMNNIDVGTSTASATYAGDSNHSGSSNSATFTISEANQATLVASSTPSTLSYGATSTLSSSGGSGTGAVSFSVGASTGCSISNGTTLTNILASGTCSVTATKAADNDYNATTSAPITITLTQATSSVTVTCPATPQPYTGSAQTPCTASYTTSDGLSGSLTPTYMNNIDVGTSTASATYAGDSNHSGSSNSATFTISEANQATLVASSTPSTLSYGATSTLSSSGGSGTGAVSFSVGASTGCSISNGTTLTNILASGTCSVTATKAADNDYNATTSAPITITLTQATSSVTVTCPATPQPYTGSAQTPCTASYTTSDGLSGSLTPTYMNNIDVGTSTASATYAGDSNHSGSSNSATFTIVNPVPTTTNISPTSTTAGNPSFTLTVDGTNFVPGSVVNFNGVAEVTTYSSPTEVTATINASDIAVAGSYPVTITNAAPGGGTSNSETFTVTSVVVTNPVPSTTSINPTSTIAGGPSFTLSVSGTNFISSSTVDFNGSALTTTFVSSSTLTAIIPSADIVTAGTASITVVTPTPGGGTSNAQTLTINNPVPTTIDTSPTSITAGSSGFTLTVDGTNFVSNSVVDWNGSARATAYVSSTQVTATINASDVATVGTTSVTVVNPTPGGGTSNAQTFTVTSIPNPIPSITSISPTSTTAGGSNFILTINGSNFVGNSTVQWNGSSTATTFVSSSTITALITAADIATVGTSSITVVNPAPGGGTSGSVIFTINPAPSGPGAVRFIFANVTSSAAVGSNVIFNIEAVNSSGTIDSTFEQGVTLTVGGSGTGGGLVTIVNGVGTSTVSDNVAETITLGLEDTQSTGLNVSAVASIMFVPGPVTQFILNHPGNMNANTRLGFVVGREDQFGNLVSSGNTVADLSSNSPSANAAFFNAASGGTQVTSTLISDGSTSTMFWYYDDTSGSRTVTVETPGITAASDTFLVAPGAVQFIFANVPSSATVGNSVTVNVDAVDSSNNTVTSFNGGVTVTLSGSATGGGLVNIVNGVGTATINDSTAETVTLGLSDTQNTGLGVVSTAQIVFNPAPVTTPLSPSPSPVQVAPGIKPGINLTFSGMAYPDASVTVIRKDQGLQAAPVTQAMPVAADGSFLVQLTNVTRLSGQTYLLSFVDKNGLIAQTKAYNIPAEALQVLPFPDGRLRRDLVRGQLEHLEVMHKAMTDSEPGLAALTAGLEASGRWALANRATAQLMFWRPVPSFEPSAEAFAPSVEMVALRPRRHG